MALILSKEERNFLDGIVVEHLQLSVEKVKFYSVEKETTVSDVLYQEPEDKWNFKQYEITAWVKKPEISVKENEPGRIIERAGVFYVARKELEDNNIPVPKIGDVLLFWGTYYDITKVEPVGFKSDSNFFTHWRGELVRRTRYVPEKKGEFNENP